MRQIVRVWEILKNREWKVFLILSAKVFACLAFLRVRKCDHNFEEIRRIWNQGAGASAECVRSENGHKALDIDRDVWNNLLNIFVFLGCQIKASWAHIERKTHSTSHFLPIPCQFGVSLQGKNILIEIRLCGIFTFEKRDFIFEFDICFNM